ncbi:MAG: DUF3465 domain-containing protein [Methylotenera sp.]
MKKYLFLLVVLSTFVACKQNTSSLSIGNTPVAAQTQVGLDHTAAAPVENAVLIEAFQHKKSNIFVEGSGIVKKSLPDDNKGSRHQKFLVTISEAQTLLFAHNIDLANAVPITVGDTIQFRGEYVYNPKGGVVHWTHHDPQSKIEGGWIKHNGKTYQ